MAETKIREIKTTQVAVDGATIGVMVVLGNMVAKKAFNVKNDQIVKSVLLIGLSSGSALLYNYMKEKKWYVDV